jgi:glycosyltransferase involved in cell wall biosynthesis
MNQSFFSVDVIIPLFNDSINIRYAIDSLLEQTYPIKNIIVVDDGSTDGSAEMIERLYSKDNRIKLVRSLHKGVSGARNVGIKIASSEFIGFLDSDDIWDRDKLRLQMDLFQANPNLGAIYCRYSVLDNEGVLRPERWVMEPSVKGDIFNTLLEGNQISGSASAVVVKRKFLNLVGEFDESLRSGEDWDMWLRLSRVCEYSFIDKNLLYIRQKNQNSRENLRQLWFKYDDNLSMWSKWPKEVSGNNKVLDLIRERCYYNYCISSRLSLIRSLKTALLMDRRFRKKMHPTIYNAMIGSILKILYKISLLKLEAYLSRLNAEIRTKTYKLKNLIKMKLSIAKTFILETPDLIAGKIATSYKWAGPFKRALIKILGSIFRKINDD